MSTMNSLKKYLGLFLAMLGMTAALPAVSHATFASHGTATVSGSVSIGGTATIAINSVTVNNRSNNAVTTALAWTGATAGGGWLMSDQYITVNHTINTSDGGLQIYTNNTAAAASPKFTGLISSNTATPAGLV